MKAGDVNKRIEKLGGQEVSQKGSHRKFSVTVDGQKYSTIVPQHGAKDIPAGTLASIQRSLEAVFGKGWLKK